SRACISGLRLEGPACAGGAAVRNRGRARDHGARTVELFLECLEGFRPGVLLLEASWPTHRQRRRALHQLRAAPHGRVRRISRAPRSPLAAIICRARRLVDAWHRDSVCVEHRPWNWPAAVGIDTRALALLGGSTFSFFVRGFAGRMLD